MAYLDSELIILEVEKHPWLFDINHPQYRNREMKRQSWVAVASAVVGEEWNDMDLETKNSIGQELQKRWKSMKDSFFKSLKAQQGKSGDPAKNKKPYIFFKQLSFLQSIVQQRETSGNMNFGICDSEETSNVTQVPVPQLKNPRPSKKRKSDAFEREFINVLKENVTNSTTQRPDSDEMFLLSQIPFIKQLTPSDKLDFQLKFIQLLKSYIPSTSSPTLSEQQSSTVSIPDHSELRYQTHSPHSNVTSPSCTLASDEESLIFFI